MSSSRGNALAVPSPARVSAFTGSALWRGVGPALLVASGYYLGCLAGFGLRFPSSGISFFWPPTALLAAALLLTAPRTWPALLVAAFGAHAIAHAQNGVPLGAWPIQFVGNAAQALLAASLVLRFSGGPYLFADARRVLIFIAGPCILAPAAASLIPAYAYVTLGWADDFWQAWSTRSITNGVAALTLLPSVVAAWQRLQVRPIATQRQIVEYGLLLLGTFAAHTIAGAVERSDVLGLSIVLYAPAPFLLWAAIRFGGAGLSLALLWTTLLTISSVSAGRGPLSIGTPGDTVVGVQVVIAATAIPMMFIAGLLEHNRREHRTLVEVERQNTATLRALPDMMFVQTRDGVYLRYYAASQEHLLVPPEVFLGRHMRDVLPPDVAETFARAFRSATADAPSVIEYDLVIHGEARRFESRLIAMDTDHILSVVRDITPRWLSENALRETQERYALATAAGGVGVWEMDLLTDHVRIEGALMETLGYGAGEIGDGLADWMALIAPADRPDVQARLAAFTSGVEKTFAAEYRMTCKNGSQRWIASVGAITDRQDGIPSRARGTYSDVTDRNEASRRLREAHDVLSRTGRIAAMAELSASLAHELKQPLTAIVANVSACVRSLDAAVPTVDIRGALQDVLDDSRRANTIVERTQEMFRSHRTEIGPLSLNDSIRKVVDLASARLREAGVTLELDLDASLPVVTADGVQIEQVLLILIVNAIEAMQEVPERALRIGSRRARNGVVISVRDTGGGFGEEDISRLFEPFVTTKSAGLGMGLSIGSSIIRNHGGTLWAVSNRDRGATFRFRLPRFNPQSRVSRTPVDLANA